MTPHDAKVWYPLLGVGAPTDFSAPGLNSATVTGNLSPGRALFPNGILGPCLTNASGADGNYVSVPAPVGFSYVNQRTVSLWVYITGAAPANNANPVAGQAIWGDTGGNEALLRSQVGGVESFYAFASVTVSFPIIKDRWVHIARRYHTAGNLELFIDGLHRGSVAGVGWWGGGNATRIGDGAGGSLSLNGSYADFRAFNRQLSDSEIYALYLYPAEVLSPIRVMSATRNIPTVIARPSADSVDGGWTNQLGSQVNLFDSINEPTPPDDADYIRSSDNPLVADITKIKLESILTPVQEPFYVRYRYKKVGSAAIDLTVRLMQGATEIAEWTHPDVSATFDTQQQTLTTPQFSAISDFTNLFLEFEALMTEPSLLLDDGTSFLLLDDGVTTLGLDS